MKTIKRQFFSKLVMGIILISLQQSCALISSSLGSVSLKLSSGGGGKTVLPIVSVTSYFISFDGPVARSPVSTDQSNPTIELETGTWDISVEGRDSGGRTVAVGGATGVVVTGGATTLVSIVLSAQYSGTGMIDVTVTWPLTVNPAIDTCLVTLDASAVPGGAVTFPTLGTAVRYVEEKAAGNYRLIINLSSGSVLRASVQEAVQVYGNLTSSATIALIDADFTSPPEAPSGLVVAEGLGKLDLSWVDNSHAETGYVVERSTGDNLHFDALAGGLPANATGYTDSTAVMGQTYWYRVAAKNSLGSGYSNEASGKVEAPIPGGAGVLTFGVVTSSSIPLSWQKATDNASEQSALAYKVVRSLSDNVRTVGDAQANGTVVQDWALDRETVDAPGLSAGTLYYFNVLVKDSAGNTSAYVSGSQSTSLPSSPPAYPLKVSANGRYLVDQNGQPFLITGDAAWSLIAELSDQDADEYLTNRKELGFNLVLVNLVEHAFSTNAPADFYGISPFTGKAFATPNDAYFTHADYIIQSAWEKGIVVLLDPTYVGYGCGWEGWCAEMGQATDAEMTAWGQYIGNRYANYGNIVWLIGGDTDPSPVKGKLQAVVAGIRQYDTRHLFTAHNGPDSMAVDPWSGETWLTINDIYTYDPSYWKAQSAYSVYPTMPFFLIEAAYDNAHGITQQQLRAQSYWTVLSGGFGSIYGNCPIWGFGSGSIGGFCTLTDWKTELNGPGSLNMKYFQKLFNSRHWYKLVPDLLHVAMTAGYGSSGAADYATAAYTSDGSSIIAYLPTSRTVTVSGSSVAGSSMKAWWCNPATGAATEIGTYPTSGTQSFTPPSSGDWVLVVDSEAFSFSAPGN